MPRSRDVHEGTLSVEIGVDLVHGESWCRLRSCWSYAVSDPYAISLSFPGQSPADTRPWLVDREVVRAGLIRPAGRGDVRIWPVRTGSSAVFVLLASPNGQMLLEVPYPDLAAFLAATDAAVAPGEEAVRLDLDSELITLLTPDGDRDST